MAKRSVRDNLDQKVMKAQPKATKATKAPAHDQRYDRAEEVLAGEEERVTRVERTSLSYLPEEAEILNKVFVAAIEGTGTPKAVKQSHLLRVGIRLLDKLTPKQLAVYLEDLPPIPTGNRGRKSG